MSAEFLGSWLVYFKKEAEIHTQAAAFKTLIAQSDRKTKANFYWVPVNANRIAKTRESRAEQQQSVPAPVSWIITVKKDAAKTLAIR